MVKHKGQATVSDQQNAALILVDVQNDFLPGGALAVPQGDQILPVAEAMLVRFELCVATQDWHPENHVGFADNHPHHNVGDVISVDGMEQTLWPRHCVQGEPGAALHETIDVKRLAHIVRKGTEPQIDSYSGFYDNQWRNATDLASWLHAHSVKHIFVMGLATDYCVKFTALDGRKLGFDVTLIIDGCRGIDAHPGDVEAAIREMCAAGVTVRHSRWIDRVERT